MCEVYLQIFKKVELANKNPVESFRFKNQYLTDSSFKLIQHVRSIWSTYCGKQNDKRVSSLADYDHVLHTN